MTVRALTHVAPYAPYAPYVLLIVRVVAALLFFQHGAQKVWGFTGSRPVPMDDLLTMRGIAGVLETVGPALLIAGFLTRFTAFILCGEMAVAYFMSWAPRGFWPINNGGEEAVLFCYFYLWVVTAGPGAFSVDAWLEHRHGQPFWWKRRLSSLEPYTRAILRIIAGFLVVQHGARKVFGVLAMVGGRRNVPPLALDGLPAVTGYLDLAAGALLMLGLFTKQTSIVIGIELLAAYVLVAAPRGPWPIANGGGEALLMVAILACLVARGPGAWSADGARMRARVARRDVPADAA